MSNLRARLFFPALLIQLFIATTITQQAFSQEAQTATPPSVAVAAATTRTEPVKDAAKDASTKEEVCEQQAPAVAAAAALAPQHAAGGGQLPVAVEPVLFKSQRELKTGAARDFAFAPGAHSRALNSFADTGAQQSGAGATPYTPLTSEQKMRRAFKSAFLSPQAYLVTGFTSAITEAREDDLPHKETDDRVADGLSRFAIRFSRRATYNLLGNGVYAVLFRQDTRYERAPEKGFGGRVAHAVSRVFVTRGDNGKLQPNYSRFAGQLSASALSNLWEQSTPGHDRIGTDATFRRFGNSFITGAIFNVVNEFIPDIKKVFGK